MKTMILGFIVFASQMSFSATQYTLQQICTKYGNFGQCSSVPFCRETTFVRGCYLAKGAPAYIEAMCKMQTQAQGCNIMAAQGNCVWVDEDLSTCDAKVQSL